VDIVLGVSIEPTTVRLVLIEGENADGVTVENDALEVAGGGDPADQVTSAIAGTTEGAAAGGYRLTSTGVTWTDATDSTDPAIVATLRDRLAAHGLGGVTLVSPVLAAAALAQSVGSAAGYERVAMLLVEPASALLAVVDVADGSFVDQRRRALASAVIGGGNQRSQRRVAAELGAMVAGLDARPWQADGVLVIGCGADAARIKPALEAATSLTVSVVEEPDMALARGAALAAAHAPLFASSTAELAWALDAGTGEVNSTALTPTYLDFGAKNDLRGKALAAGARTPVVLVASAVAAVSAITVGGLLVGPTSNVRPEAASHPPAPASPPAARSMPAAPPPSAVAAPPVAPVAPVAPAAEEAFPTIAKAAPPTPVRRAPIPRAPAPVQQAAPKPAAPAPPPAAPAPPPPAAVPPQPAPPTIYLRVPFLGIPIPINVPPPAGPPAHHGIGGVGG
jgi:hypothetical protein